MVIVVQRHNVLLAQTIIKQRRRTLGLRPRRPLLTNSSPLVAVAEVRRPLGGFLKSTLTQNRYWPPPNNTPTHNSAYSKAHWPTPLT